MNGHRPLADKASELPLQPGVYLMKDGRGRVIYVGKAKNLRSRVRSYFTGEPDVKTRHLLARMRDFEIIVTGSETEALLLENNLIKNWKPRYNINLKDGKSYPVIRLTAEEYPRVFRTRRIVLDGSRYFGPFPHVGTIDLYLNLVDRLFPLRKCKGPIRPGGKPCFYYHIGRCSGVCAGKIGREEYLQRVEQVRLLLSGRTEELLRELKSRMQAAAAALSFEKAAVYRDRIQAVESLAVEQKVVDFRDEARDYVGYWNAGTAVQMTVLLMRDGRLVGRDVFRMESYSGEAEFLPEFLARYYGGKNAAPRVLYLPDSADAAQPRALERLLADLTGHAIQVRYPKKGRHARLVSMAAEISRHSLEQGEQVPREGLEGLQQVLGLAVAPHRIEGFDIAHLAGRQTVASLVSFSEGRPRRSEYRHYHIRSLNGRIDDFEAIREVVARRYARQLNEGGRLPDLILIDGGRGQVSAACGVLEALEVSGIPVVGLAKRNEELYLPDRPEPLVLPETSAALRLLQAVRDEAHRFATTFHKKVRAVQLNTSVLESVPGFGKVRSRRLLERYGSLEAIASSSAEALREACGVGLPQAATLLEKLKGLQNGRQEDHREERP